MATKREEIDVPGNGHGEPERERANCLLVGRVVRFEDRDVPLSDAALEGHGRTVRTSDDGSFIFPLDGLPLPAKLTVSAPGCFSLTETVDWSQIVSGGLLFRDFAVLRSTGNQENVEVVSPEHTHPDPDRAGGETPKDARRKATSGQPHDNTKEPRWVPPVGSTRRNTKKSLSEIEREHLPVEELPPLQTPPPVPPEPKEQFADLQPDQDVQALLVPEPPRSEAGSFVSLDGLRPAREAVTEEIHELVITLSEDPSHDRWDPSQANSMPIERSEPPKRASVDTVERLESLSWGEKDPAVSGEALSSLEEEDLFEEPLTERDGDPESVAYPDFEDLDTEIGDLRERTAQANSPDEGSLEQDWLDEALEDDFDIVFPWDDEDPTPAPVIEGRGPARSPEADRTRTPGQDKSGR